jgi:hypothetical protein
VREARGPGSAFPQTDALEGTAFTELSQAILYRSTPRAFRLGTL